MTAPPASVNEPPEVRIDGLDAGQAVELHATWRSDFDGERWTSTLPLRADDGGTAVAGPEVLTTMQPPEGAETEFFPLLGRNRIALDVRSDGETIARGTLVREFVPVTTELAVESDFIAGLYFAPADPGGSPVLVLGGSEGSYWGLAREASALAAAGHPVLSLAYFGEPDLQQRLERVPADLVRVGVKWLRNMTEERQVAVMGVSRGGELALLAASLEPSLAADVVALVPSSRVGFCGDRRAQARLDVGGRAGRAARADPGRADPRRRPGRRRRPGHGLALEAVRPRDREARPRGPGAPIRRGRPRGRHAAALPAGPPDQPDGRHAGGGREGAPGPVAEDPRRAQRLTSTTSKSRPLSTSSSCSTSLFQRRSGAPEMNQSEPLSATISP